jgi:hypothetical protein
MRQEALPEGLLPMNGRGFSGSSTREEVAVNTAAINTPTELTRRFFGQNNPETLLILPLSDGSEVRLHAPTGRYTPLATMVVAHGPEFDKLPPEETITTQNIYEYSENTQAAYWGMLIHGLEAYRDTLDTDKYRIFAGGNWVAQHSNFDERTARTVGLPHDHLCAVRKKDIKPYIEGGVEAIEGLTEEKTITNRLLPHFLPRLERALPEDFPLRLETRTNLPYGYSFVIPADAGMATVAQLMKDHNTAYEAVANTIKTRHEKRGAEIHTQPSYQLYIELDEQGDRHVTISPSFLSAAGVLESAGIQLKRNPYYEEQFTDAEVSGVQTAVAKGIQKRFASQYATIGAWKTTYI